MEVEIRFETWKECFVRYLIRESLAEPHITCDERLPNFVVLVGDV